MKKKLAQPFLVMLVILVAFLGIFGIAKLLVNAPVPSDKDTSVSQGKVTPDELFSAINKVRRDNGLEQFKRNALLDKSSELKCGDMVANRYYDHHNPTTDKKGSSYIKDVGQYYMQASENLNKGIFTDSADVVRSWMGSEPHRKSIVNPKFTEIGFAVCEVDGQVTVVQHKIEPVAEVQQATYVSSHGTDDCTSDCSGHDAGYEWAEQHDICDPEYDRGNSESFNEGVIAWAYDNCYYGDGDNPF